MTWSKRTRILRGFALLWAVLAVSYALWKPHAMLPVIDVSASDSPLPIAANTRSGIYHWGGCPQYPRAPWLPHWRAFSSREAAEAAGFRPARNCRESARGATAQGP